MSGLEHLWAGWRSEYITSTVEQSGPTQPSAGAAGSPDGPERCVFCRILAGGADDAETHVVWRHPSGLVVALLNAYPYATGHLMVMPVRHVGELEDLEPAEAAALWAGVVRRRAGPQGGLPPGRAQRRRQPGAGRGAGVPGHFHVHVLPRWNGDTNFMTTVADTRVLPEALSVTYDKLRAAWPR